MTEHEFKAWLEARGFQRVGTGGNLEAYVKETGSRNPIYVSDQGALSDWQEYGFDVCVLDTDHCDEILHQRFAPRPHTVEQVEDSAFRYMRANPGLNFFACAAAAIEEIESCLTHEPPKDEVQISGMEGGRQ